VEARAETVKQLKKEEKTSGGARAEEKEEKIRRKVKAKRKGERKATLGHVSSEAPVPGI
jgi:hypothetical protein